MTEFQFNALADLLGFPESDKRAAYDAVFTGAKPNVPTDNVVHTPAGSSPCQLVCDTARPILQCIQLPDGLVSPRPSLSQPFSGGSRYRMADASEPMSL